MDFVALDFETANEKRSSPCAVGVVVVRQGCCVERFMRLIRPQPLRFSPYNTAIHGISAEDVADEPEFDAVWDWLRPHLEGQTLLAHNASFDISVLRCTLDLFGIPYPDLEYNCTRLISKEVWHDFPSYSLDYIAGRLGIEFEHHNAVEDSRACAEIARYACEVTKNDTLDSLANALRITPGRLFCGGYQPARCESPHRPSVRKEPAALVPSTTDFDPHHPLFGTTVVFTGELESMTRAEAMQQVLDVGGSCGTSVTRHTNYLVVGDIMFGKFRGGYRSGKMKRAEELIAEGRDVEVISEHEFLTLLLS